MRGGPSRRLVIGLAFLLIDSNSVHNSTYVERYHIINGETSVDKQNEQIFWLVDDDGLCFGQYGFHACSELNAWKFHNVRNEQYMLEPYISTEELINQHESSSSIGFLSIEYDTSKISPIINTESKSLLGNHKWNYNSELGKLSIDVFNPYEDSIDSHCISKDSETLNGDSILIPCTDNFSKLNSIEYPIKHIPMSMPTLNVNRIESSKLITSGYWECPVTRLHLPRSIKLDNSENPQVFMGAGIYTKVTYVFF